MRLVDTHCHIQSSDVTDDGVAGMAGTLNLWAKAGFPTGDDIVSRADVAGVSRMIIVGCTLPDSEQAVKFVQNRQGCYASIGIHPHEAKDYVTNDAGSRSLKAVQLKQFANLAAAERVVAIGECGLDYHYEYSDPNDQKMILQFQIELALQHDLPLIFHVRESFTDFWEIYDSYVGRQKWIRGVLHSYTDNRENLEKALTRGLYIGVNGISTFTKQHEQREIYKSIPLSRLLLETDSPFLTPSPYRGNICEPYHTRVTAEFLAELRNESIDQLADATTANACQLFTI